MAINRVLCLIMLSLSAVPAAGERQLFRSIPDFTQTTVRGAAHGNGQQFCAPAAVSNSLVWLQPSTVEQKQLVLRLASADYMNTSLKNGTGTSGVLRGVDRYIKETLGSYRQLAYQGWRKHPSRFSTGVRVPTLEFMRAGVTESSAAWLNVGWYRIDRAAGEYRRIGGHWVTLVGYDTQASQLILNDPAPRAGSTPSHEYVTFRALRGGRLVGKKSGLPTDARGYLQLSRGMPLHPKAETAIIDGVVVLQL